MDILTDVSESEKCEIVREGQLSELDAEEHQWFNALVTDDVTFVDLLRAKPEQERMLFLDGPLEHSSRMPRAAITMLIGNGHVVELMKLPIMVAVRHGSMNVLAAMLDLGADPSVVDSRGCNVFHSMIMMCKLFPEYEKKMADTYGQLTSIFGQTICKKLLFAENSDGLRPLELASRDGLVILVKTILHTRGVYLISEQSYGMITCQQFEITEYETNGPCGSRSRSNKSPLGFLTYMSTDTAAKPETEQLLAWMPFTQWQRYKVRASILWMLLWFLGRLILINVLLALLVDNTRVYTPTTDTSPLPLVQMEASTRTLATTGGVTMSPPVTLGDDIESPPGQCYKVNDVFSLLPSLLSGSTQHNTFTIVIAAVAGIGLLVDITELIITTASKGPQYRRAIKPGNTMVLFFFPRITQFVYFVTVILLCVRIQFPEPSSVTFDNLIRLVMTMLSGCTSMTFLFGVPVLGHYINSLMRMLSDILFIVITYIIMMFPFAAFYTMFFEANSRQGCVEDYGDIQSSMYSLYLVSFFERDFSDYDVTDRSVMIVTHIIFTILVGILLINFLIAVMSETASSMSKQKTMIMRLERLHYAFTTENRLFWLFGGYYDVFREKYLTVSKGRIFLTNVLLEDKPT